MRLIAQGIERRRAILRFVKAYWKQNGFAPSIDEIAADTGLASKTAVRHHLATMVREGDLAVTPGKYRSLVVVEKKKKSKVGAASE